MSIQWVLVFFILLVGLGCGTFVVTIFTTEWCGKVRQIRKTGMITSLVILALGGVTSVFHLTHPERIFGALSHPTSGIFMESSMIGLVGLIIIIYLIALRRDATDSTLKIIGTIGMIPAVILAFAIGHSYMMAARPAWNTLILPLNYFVSAGVMGCVCFNILVARNKNADPTVMAGLNRATLISLAIQAVLVIVYIIYLSAAPYQAATRSASRVLAGDLAPLFWGGIVLLGLLVPTVLIAQIKKEKDKLSTLVMRVQISLVCIILGGIAFRVMMFALGSSIKQYF
jgi:anaerobic dimethyl sulfoxide reductase subunit C (anchor subunit)